MTRPVRLALIGAGSRGMNYSREAVGGNGAVVTAIAEPRRERLEIAAREFGVPPHAAVADWRALLEQPEPPFDAVIVATPDREHVEPALAFIERGLPLLLEKPMSPTEEDALRIVETARRRDVLVCVAHVLRYSRYTQALHRVIDSGAIGRIASIEHLEPVGWWHQAHSFVRGNWRREEESSSMLMSKSCHDIDWLSSLIGRPAVSVSSFGGLMHFTKENQPEGAAARCLDCSVERTCAYSAKRIYLSRVDDPAAQLWPLGILSVDTSEQGITKALREGPYGRCVYDSDNDVVDHQVVNVEYEGGATVSFTMTAFTPMSFRKTRVFGTKGMIEGDGYGFSVFDFLTGTTTTTQLVDPRDSAAADGHLGSDAALTAAFIAAVATGDRSLVLTNAEESLHTHAIVWAAERARHAGRVERIGSTPPHHAG